MTDVSEKVRFMIYINALHFRHPENTFLELGEIFARAERNRLGSNRQWRYLVEKWLKLMVIILVPRELPEILSSLIFRASFSPAILLPLLLTFGMIGSRIFGILLI